MLGSHLKYKIYYFKYYFNDINNYLYLDKKSKAKKHYLYNLDYLHCI